MNTQYSVCVCVCVQIFALNIVNTYKIKNKKKNLTMSELCVSKMQI